MKARLRIVLAFSFIAVVVGLIGSWGLYSHIGRTPGELVRYAERRLQGHSKLEYVALPVLGGMLTWLNEPGYGDMPPPFPVPALRSSPIAADDGLSPLQAVNVGVRPANQRPERGARVLRVGANREVASVAAAAVQAKDGDIIEIDAGDYYADVAVWDRAQLTIRGVGGKARLIAAGAAAEDKAIWVIRRGSVTIENVDFVGARVSDRNGAGIRFESGFLIVRKCLFFDNENGLLATGGAAELEIENSEFGHNGVGDGLSHNLYVGDINSLKVTGSYFHHANVGHLIKSRAKRNVIAYNRLTDEIDGRASYELEFPNGGVAYVIGNIVQQSAQTSNSTMISFGAEGYAHSTSELYLINNTLINDHPHGGAFLRVSPGAQVVKTQNNLLVGIGKFHTPEIHQSTNDVRADWGSFARASRYDYRLNAKGRQQTVTRTGIARRSDLTPDSEYVHPTQVKKLAAPPSFPGAVQTPVP